MALPKFISDDQAVTLLQSTWATQLDPILRNPISSGLLLKELVLASGDNAINHRLGRKLQGWMIVRKRANVDIYDKQDSNTVPELTLTLNAASAVTVDLYVF